MRPVAKKTQDFYTIYTECTVHSPTSEVEVVVQPVLVGHYFSIEWQKNGTVVMVVPTFTDFEYCRIPKFNKKFFRLIKSFVNSELECVITLEEVSV